MFYMGVLPRKLTSCVAILAAAGIAHAASVSTTFFQIDVDDGVNNASWNVASASPFVTFSPGTEIWDWSSAGQSIDLSGIATVGTANLQVQGAGSNRISLGFALTAGTSDVTVTVTTTVLSFGTLATPDGLASVAMTLTDNGGDGASLAGVGGDAGSAFASYYGAPAGTVFAEFVSSLAAVPGGTDIGVGNTGGFIPVGAPVSTTQVLMSFELSAGDQVSSTSSYLVTPEPAGLLLLAVGGVLAVRRRR